MTNRKIKQRNHKRSLARLARFRKLPYTFDGGLPKTQFIHVWYLLQDSWTKKNQKKPLFDLMEFLPRVS